MKQYTQNNFLSYLLILASFFVLLFFTKNIYSDMQVQLDTREQNTLEVKQKQDTLARLNELKNSLNKEGSELTDDIAGFTGVFSDADIIEYIYSYARDVNLGDDRIIIRDISLTSDSISDLGFKKALINVSAVVSWEKVLFSFIDKLTGKWSTYRFYITDFNYPMNESSGNIQANIPLTLYYK